MAAKKKKTYSAAPRRSYAARPKKRARRKSGIADIPAAGMTIGLVAANKYGIKSVIDSPSVPSVKAAAKWAIQPEQLKRDAVYGVIGFTAGAAVKKFAPRFIKTPLGKIAKKIPKVF